jgi:hypothetical protein
MHNTDKVIVWRKIIKSVRNLFFWVVGILFLFGMAIMFGEHIEFIPDNAMVFINETEKTIFAPPLLPADDRDFLIFCKLEYAERFGFKKVLAKNSEIADDIGMAAVDIKRKIYFVGFPDEKYIILKVANMGDVKKEYKGDKKHRDLEGFNDSYGFVGFIKSILGLRKSRWTKEGNWNW